MNKKEAFEENLKSVPSSLEEIKNTKELSWLLDVVKLLDEKNYEEAYSILIGKIGLILENSINKTRIEMYPKTLLLISEIPNIDEDLRDLVIDLMLVIEENKINKKSYDDFRNRLKKIKTR